MVSELAKNHTKSVGSKHRLSTLVMAGVIGLSLIIPMHTFVAGNTPGTGNGVVIGTGSSAPKAENVSIGQNAYARSGSVMFGTHNYRGALGDVTVDSVNTKSNNMTLFSITLGANSYTNGLFSSVTGAYYIASSDYNTNATSATKNFGSTITGSLNSIESATSSSNIPV